MQDVEFTVQDRQLYLLQTRNGKRTPQACARIALDLWEDGVIDAATALERTRHLDARALTLQRVASANGDPLTPLVRAANASSGVACGEIVLDEDRARARKSAGAQVTQGII